MVEISDLIKKIKIELNPAVKKEILLQVNKKIDEVIVLFEIRQNKLITLSNELKAQRNIDVKKYMQPINY